MPEAAFELSESGDTYIVRVTSSAPGHYDVRLGLDRSLIETTVLENCDLQLELMPNGQLAAYADNRPECTLVRRYLSEVVRSCFSVQSISADLDSNELLTLKRELNDALKLIATLVE